jgi:hypothetical protein
LCALQKERGGDIKQAGDEWEKEMPLHPGRRGRGMSMAVASVWRKKKLPESVFSRKPERFPLNWPFQACHVETAPQGCHFC